LNVSKAIEKVSILDLLEVGFRQDWHEQKGFGCGIVSILDLLEVGFRLASEVTETHH